MRIKRIVGIGALSVVAAAAAAQVSVDVNLNMKQTVGGISTFDREKFIVLHAGLRDGDWDSPAQRDSFLNDYDVYLGRNNGSLPWNLSQTTEDPAKPGWVNHANMVSRGNSAKATYGADTAVHSLEFRENKMMIGGQMSMYPNGQTNGNGFAIADYDALGDYYAQYLTDFYGNGGTTGEPKPAMVEVVNEPFVAANNYGTTRANISQMHNNVAVAIKAAHPNVMVGGYTAAHPQYEGNNFAHWNDNWKTFIDIAGTNMDFFSLHLYDNPVGSTNVLDTLYRSGSNIEALLDMIEQYSMISMGKVLPFNISEYGSLSITNGAPYVPANDWVDVRSYSTILMQLLERPDRIVQAIPFMILKAEWGRKNGYPYPTRLLWNLDEVNDPKSTAGAWAYTERIKFFELWKEVKGTRVDTISSDPDVQIDAYVDGTNAFVIVSSLDHTGPQTVDLNLFGKAQSPTAILVKHSYADATGLPILDTYTTNQLPSITLPASSTAVIKYMYSSPVVQSEQSLETKYYATDYLQPITANTPIIFSITNVVRSAPYGEAVLRLGIGRDHGVSLHPTVLVNGTAVSVPTDWRGYDQSTRTRFFGVLEIPVPYTQLQSNNTISVEFPDNGGHVASVAMQVFELTADVHNAQGIIPISSHQFVGNDVILGITNGPPDGYFALWTKTNLMDASWTVSQSNLPVNAMGAAWVTNSALPSIQFFRAIKSDPPPVPVTVIGFTLPDYSNGALNGQQNWNAEAGWTVADASGAGNASTADNGSAAVLNSPVQLTAGQTYSLSLNVQFGGTYATPTNFVYTMLGGLKVSSAGASEGTGGTAADANVQLYPNVDTYRLLNNYSPIAGAANITTAPLNPGDILQFDYQLTLGTDAATTTYLVRLQNLTDGTDTGAGTVTGVDSTIYAALTGSGAYGFFQTIVPGNNASGLSGLQVNTVTTTIIP